MGRWWVGKANHNLILLRVFLYPQVPVLTHRLAALRPSGVRIYDGRSVASSVSSDVFKMFLTMSTLLVGGSTKEARRVSRSVETAVADKISKQIDLKNVFGWANRAIISGPSPACDRHGCS